MEWGTLAGLAARGTADKQVEDLKYIEQLHRQNEAMNIAKTKMFMDDIEFQNGSNPYDAAIIKQESLAAMKQLGELRKNNPNWMYDIGTQTQMKYIKQGMKGTDAVLRSIAYKDAVGEYSKFLKEVQQNPDKYNLDQLQDFKNRLTNYSQFGHEGGPDAAAKEGPKPLIFTPPEEIPDFNEVHRKMGDSMNPTKYETLNNGRDGAYIGYVDDDSLTKAAQVAYMNNKSAYDYKYKGKDVVAAIKDEIKPFIKIDYKIGERNGLADAMALEEYKARLKRLGDAQAAGKEVHPYRELVNTKSTVDDPKALAATFGSDVPYMYRDVNGKLVKGQGQPFNYEGSILDKGYDSKKKYQRTGTKVTPGYVEMPVEWGKEQGYLTSPFFGDPEVKPEHLDKVEIVTTAGPDGKPIKKLHLKAFNEVDANSPAYALKYDSFVKATTKQRDALGIDNSYMNEGREYQMDAQGNKYYKGIDY